MKKMNKILKAIGVVLAVLAVTGLLGFVGSKRAAALCEEMVVHIQTEGKTNLITETEIRNTITEKVGIVVGEPLYTIHTKTIEAQLYTNPFVKQVKAYATINKKLVIDLQERKPLIRIIDQNGQNAIIDSEGFLMPVSPNATLRLPVITGNFEMNKSAPKENKSVHDSIMNSVFPTIYNYARTIDSDDFWRAQIQHTHVNDNGDFIAYPQVGNHNINFGPGNEIENKLDRLFIFYKKGLGEAGWNKYANINLKYKDQIVCTKK